MSCEDGLESNEGWSVDRFYRRYDKLDSRPNGPVSSSDIVHISFGSVSAWNKLGKDEWVIRFRVLEGF